MSETREWPRIAVVGAGAVGGYFGGVFARAGAPTVFIGRQHFADAVNSKGLVLDKSEGQERIRAKATVEMSAVRDCSLILFCVKANNTSTTAAQMAPFVRPDATIVCLQNGVDNADQVRAAANAVAVPAVVYVAVSVPEPCRVKHLARGDLIIGPPSERKTELADLFARAGIPCRISDNIAAELWTKLIMNCAYNAISALGRTRYGLMKDHPLTRNLMRQVIAEVAAVASAAGVILPDLEQLTRSTLKLGDAMPHVIHRTGFGPP
jgi:2-dehydropantoate 2-reductase